VLIFGFIGGITGVTLGTQQINIIAHNTLRITGHFHATVVGGTSLAFMALTYYVIPLIFRRDFIWRGLARAQPWLFGGGILLVSLGMSFAGSMGVPRRIYDIDHSGAFGPAAHLMLAVMGVGAIIAVVGLLLFVVLCVGTILFGERNAGRAIADWGTARALAGSARRLARRRPLGHARNNRSDGGVSRLLRGLLFRQLEGARGCVAGTMSQGAERIADCGFRIADCGPEPHRGWDYLGRRVSGKRDAPGRVIKRTDSTDSPHR
jgi:hypothetical protein